MHLASWLPLSGGQVSKNLLERNTHFRVCYAASILIDKPHYVVPPSNTITSELCPLNSANTMECIFVSKRLTVEAHYRAFRGHGLVPFLPHFPISARPGDFHSVVKGQSIKSAPCQQCLELFLKLLKNATLCYNA